MVWFQCEDCGENLKKPKLPRHFHICSATKLSCLDCGTIFGQDSVQWHTQCLTEAEKYGPKGPHANPKQQLDFDINVHLPNRPSWFCRLCDAKTTSEQDFLGHVRGIKHRERAQGFDAKQQKEFEQPIVYNENNQLSDFDISVGLSNQYPWHCSLCNTKSTSQQSLLLDHAKGKKHRENVAWFNVKQQQRQSEQLTGDNENSEQQPDFDINVGLSNSYPWFCSLCNAKATSQQNLLDHANGRKHRINVKRFNPTQQQQQQQVEHSTMDKEKSVQQTEVDIYVGLSSCYPWFCSLCNIKAASQQILHSHANGKTHLANVGLFNANQVHQAENSTMDKKDRVENTYPGNSEQKKVELLVPSGVANGYSQADKKRKLEAVNEPWNGKVLRAEEAEGGGEKKSESNKAKKLDHEKKEKKDRKQTESDSRFDFDKEDLKQLLVSYSKEELVNLVYMTAEKGSRLVSTIFESADSDISHCNIFVRGFGWDTTREDLKAAFESYGEIEDCSVVMDNNTGRSKGYGFVLFKRRKGAREALKIPEKRIYNRTVVCNLASVKPSRIENQNQMANQSETALPRPELAHGHVHEQMGHQQTMDMFGPNMPFYGYSQPPGFDPMYGALRSNQMVGSLPNYSMLGSGLMNHGSMLPPNHVGMTGQYFGDGEHAWYPR